MIIMHIGEAWRCSPPTDPELHHPLLMRPQDIARWQIPHSLDPPWGPDPKFRVPLPRVCGMHFPLPRKFPLWLPFSQRVVKIRHLE